METVIVDTNVIVVANKAHDGVSPDCVSRCALALESIISGGRIAIDDAWRILKEYMDNTNNSRPKGLGDVFVKWVLQNHKNTSRCDLVKLEDHSKRIFKSFPKHDGLDKFDNSDRKFVAVAKAHPRCPKILQAADSKWVSWSQPLSECGVTVEFVCPDDIKKFHQKKSRK